MLDPAAAVLMTTMLAATAFACIFFAALVGGDAWGLFVTIGLGYFCVTVVQYIRLAGTEHYR